MVLFVFCEGNLMNCRTSCKNLIAFHKSLVVIWNFLKLRWLYTRIFMLWLLISFFLVSALHRIKYSASIFETSYTLSEWIVKQMSNKPYCYTSETVVGPWNSFTSILCMYLFIDYLPNFIKSFYYPRYMNLPVQKSKEISSMLISPPSIHGKNPSSAYPNMIKILSPHPP